MICQVRTFYFALVCMFLILFTQLQEIRNKLFLFLFQVFWLLLKPKGLQDHQKRPQDFEERTLDDLIRERKGLPPRVRKAPQQQPPAYNGRDNPGFEKSDSYLDTKL